MKPSRIAGIASLALLVSLFPAKWGNSAVEQLCLAMIPEWVDKIIYWILRPLLSADIGDAAEQMDFIEVWFASFVIINLIIFAVLLVYQVKCGPLMEKQETD